LLVDGCPDLRPDEASVQRICSDANCDLPPNLKSGVAVFDEESVARPPKGNAMKHTTIRATLPNV
jgi:hypothetical protein